MNRTKKLLLIPVLISACTVFLQAEAVVLKNGTILTGSILSQNEHILNLQTKYGVVPVSQRNIAEIMPDKHRISFTGGGEIVGVIEDIDQFNIRLKTDNGYVNIDMSKVASVDVYDYEQTANQQKYVAEQNKAAEAAAAAAAAGQDTTKAAATGGISFDDDIDRIFTPKAPTQAVEYIPVRNTGAAQTKGTLTASAPEVYSAPLKRTTLRRLKWLILK
ncbi:hypothetical protein Dip510_001191 [Elusimicrobium posterum]|uniref:hypothetical protein n=1 Tax=Elusimicrobium posterum TaxID=3116653 RepID=UPI003C794D27